MAVAVEPVAPGLSSSSVVASEMIAAALLAQLGITVDTDPLDSDDLPDKAMRRPAAQRSAPYWVLTWEGRTSRQVAFGSPDSYPRRLEQQYRLLCYWPLSGGKARTAEWQQYLEDAANALEADRSLGGRVASMTVPTITSRGPRRKGETRYHAGELRFAVVMNDRLHLMSLEAQA